MLMHIIALPRGCGVFLAAPVFSAGGASMGFLVSPVVGTEGVVLW